MIQDPTIRQLRDRLAISHGALHGPPDPRLRCLAGGDRERPELRWGHHQTPFGPVLAAVTAAGALCWLNFIKGSLQGSEAEALGGLAKAWPGSRQVEDPAASMAAIILAFQPELAPSEPLPLRLRGTPIQLAVWRMLLRIPRGALVTYGELAAAVGHAKAVRAAGSAVGANPVSVLVPCHRVIGKAGDPFKYGGGPERKRALLAWELLGQSPSTSAMP